MCRVPRFVVELSSFFSLMTVLQVEPLACELQMGAVLTASPDTPVTILQYMEDNNADQSAEKNMCHTLPYLRVASVEPPWFANCLFSKMFCKCKMFCETLRGELGR